MCKCSYRYQVKWKTEKLITVEKSKPECEHKTKDDLNENTNTKDLITR